ncbi:PAS domain S-box protein [Spirosoma linguale]|uniref:histidine kinase n=1 Tax=Spirosoma linguale (strain ATCC 33905 / DSM 74 / LMG 10896 / Claus 1) TaxID=504472 RepID=D2QM90_SPILD|nr:multi-sensor hybrid histidine kinase [Spirosoma linguale DSM 74]
MKRETPPLPVNEPLSTDSLHQENERLRAETKLLKDTIRQQQAELRRIEQRWKFALEGFGDAVWELNLQTREIIRSARYREILGYTLEEFPDIVEVWMDKLHPQDWQNLTDPDMSLYLSGVRKSHVTEYRLLAKDGTYKHFLDKGRVFSYSEDGKPLLMIGTSTDITHQKNIEEALRTSAHRLSNLIADFQEGILLEDENRAIVLVNQQFCNMFSVPLKPDELVGVDCSGMAEQSKGFFREQDAFVARVNQLLQEQKLVIGEEISLADGRTFERDYIPIFIDGVYAGHLWKYTDITKRKHAEDAAFYLNEKYQRIIENMNLGLIEVDLEERIVYTNQSFCAMSGYEPDELIGQVATDILLKGQNIQFMKEKNESRLRGNVDAYEVSIKNKRGDAMWWLVSGAPLYSQSGQVIGSTGIHLDITKQKQLESELRVAKQEAEHSARVKELFLANMSHEIRTPMNAILNLGQQITKTSLTEHQQFFIGMINTAASNLLVIINDILDFSKIEAGELSLEHINFDLADLIGQAVQVMTHDAEKKGLVISTEIGSGLPPTLLGDPFRINQILLNLIGNSVKFTNAGSVHIQCNSKKVAGNQLITLSVTDTGIGIAPEFLSNLFTKFTQEDGSIGRRYGGSGLGMSITKQLVDLMGGTIDVKSEKNKGTTVTVKLSLPIGKNENEVNQKQTTPNEDLLQTKRILLVEDNAMNRLVVTTILRPYGVTIVEETNGYNAVERLRKETFDIVLMDVQMPVMDGLEATRITREEISKSLPIIALTASVIRSEKEECFNVGMNDFLAKPFEGKELVSMLMKWLTGTIEVVEPEIKEADGSLYNLSRLEMISRGSQEFIQKMIQLFCTEAPDVATQIKAAYEVGDFAKVKYLAHRIKPTIDTMDITSQIDAIRKIEELAIIGENSSEFKSLVDDFEKTIHQVTEHMQQTYGTGNN